MLFKATTFDRTDFTPPHIGPKVLPNNPFFSALLRHAHAKDRLAIRDVNQENRSWTYAQLTSDILHLRNSLVETLPVEIFQQVRDQEECCVGVLAAGGYEYVVAVLAVLASGFAVVPMTVALPVEEASYFVTKSNQVAILMSESASELGKSIADRVNQDLMSDGRPHKVQYIPVMPLLRSNPFIPPSTVSLSSDKYLSDNSAGIVIFTSGTTGPPKGAVIRRGYIHEASRSMESHFGLTPADTLLHLLPVHHVTGLAINILPFLIAGACIEFRSVGFDPQWTWERFRETAERGLTIFSGVPTIYMRLMRWYETNLADLSANQRAPYEAGVRRFRAMLCGTSALPRPVAQFWSQLRGGQGILTRYGSTEIGAVLAVPLDDSRVPDGSVGKIIPGVELKLVENSKEQNEEGEILVKTPHLFSKYLSDPDATKNSFTRDGWFMTGDIARRKGDWYWIIGRASQDIIKSGGYKISALDVEREILGLPYVNEVSVMGVKDDEFGERVAALLTLREGQERKTVEIDDLRDDLRLAMASYKMPTLLRVMSDELPKTASGKVLKKVLGPKLFPQPGWQDEKAVQVWRPRARKL